MTLTPLGKRAATIAGASALVLALAACSAEEAEVTASSDALEVDSHDDHDHEAEETSAASTEMAAQTPRIVVTYDGGILVLDANTLETEADIALDGFTRLNVAGDGRHVGVSTTGGFQILDAGTWSQAHGDHAHYFTTTPTLTDLWVEAETPGHLVVHDGLAAFFDDGTGQITVVEADEWEHMVEEGHLDIVREHTTESAHHGVAVASDGGELMITIGDEDSRDGAMLLDGDDAVISSSEQCPGVHGETAFETSDGDELFMVGCEDGVLVFHGDHVHKIDAGVDFARTGNLHSVDGDDIVLGDRRTDPDGGINLTEITLIDPEAETIQVVDPFSGDEAEYTWRGLARGVDGESLVLGTDGALRVIDSATGDVLRSIDVIDAWEAPEEWQTAHPALTVLAGMAYVTEPATGTLHIVDYVGGEVWKSVEVGVATNEIVGVTG
ncbi:hypothetical protein [Demequina mangrovi]|uniref:PQQ-like domain-containing protein n=1 Tax=Demequina mangrovi TaxID=1043493 RepID=A0A1H6ZYD6_9MICO|nr:hypothetical protein [Demequina mangrovi]SEJ58489.1 hypothetical protein SAMN05421637_2304 [Demequina mangrovi]